MPADDVTATPPQTPDTTNAPIKAQRPRTGFLTGGVAVPEDFNTMGAKEIRDLFESKTEDR